MVMSYREKVNVLETAEKANLNINILTTDNQEFKNFKITDLDLEDEEFLIYAIEDDKMSKFAMKIKNIKNVECFSQPDELPVHSDKNSEQNHSPQEQLIIEKCDDLKELLIRKNRDYGNSAEKSFNKWGHKAFMIRIEDKMNRLENLIKNGENNLVKDESLYDTVLDLAGYELLWLVELSKKENKNEN